MGMRLIRHSVRFILAAFVIVVAAGPASAGSVPPGYQPHPSHQPSTHRSQTAAWEISHIRAPSIGLDEPILAGIDESVLNKGVGHWSGTALPGEEGNVVLGGHRTTFTHPFREIHRLVAGDIIYVTDAKGSEVMYRVRETFVVDPSDTWITWDQGSPTLTLFACHPLGSAESRIVVVADLVSREGIS